MTLTLNVLLQNVTFIIVIIIMYNNLGFVLIILQPAVVPTSTNEDEMIDVIKCH